MKLLVRVNGVGEPVLRGQMRVQGVLERASLGLSRVVTPADLDDDRVARIQASARRRIERGDGATPSIRMRASLDGRIQQLSGAEVMSSIVSLVEHELGRCYAYAVSSNRARTWRAGERAS
jgi:GTPase